MTSEATPVPRYEPMTLVRLAALLAEHDGQLRWRLLAEFLEEFSWEPPVERLRADARATAQQASCDVRAEVIAAPGRSHRGAGLVPAATTLVLR